MAEQHAPKASPSCMTSSKLNESRHLIGKTHCKDPLKPEHSNMSRLEIESLIFIKNNH